MANDPKHPGIIGGHAFEVKVLASLERIEKALVLTNEAIQVVDNKIDVLLLKEKPPPPLRPTGVQINQLTHKLM